MCYCRVYHLTYKTFDWFPGSGVIMSWSWYDATDWGQMLVVTVSIYLNM